MKRVATFSVRKVLLLPLLLILGCHSSPPHPPKFADFQRAFRTDGQNAMEAQLDVFRAAMLSPDEMRIILVRSHVDELIGAATQAHIHDDMAGRLLARAEELEPSNALVWAAVAYREIDLFANRTSDSQRILSDLPRCLEMWRSLAPTNSAPLYLAAAFQCLQSNLLAAQRLAVEAAQAEGFENYSVPIKWCAVRSMEAVGYSKYTARVVACGNNPGIVGWSKLANCILKQAPEEDQAVRACLALGSHLSRGGSFLEELIGDSIQTRCMDKLTGDFSAQRGAILERKSRIRRATQYLNSARTRQVPEQQWIEYYDRCFDTTEMSAIQWLAGRQGDNLGF